MQIGQIQKTDSLYFMRQQTVTNDSALEPSTGNGIKLPVPSPPAGGAGQLDTIVTAATDTIVSLHTVGTIPSAAAPQQTLDELELPPVPPRTSKTPLSSPTFGGLFSIVCVSALAA